MLDGVLGSGRHANLTMFGIASKSKHAILTEYGATLIDYRPEDFVEVIRRAEPGGLDAVFDGMGGDYIDRAFPLLRRGGVLVGYGNPLSMRGLVHALAKILVLNLVPTVGRSSPTAHLRSCPSTEGRFWRIRQILFRLLQEGKIRPVISAEFPLLEAARANALLETGQVIGNLVLVTPELLEAREMA